MLPTVSHTAKQATCVWCVAAVPGPGLTCMSLLGKVSAPGDFLAGVHGSGDLDCGFGALSPTRCSKSVPEQLRTGWLAPACFPALGNPSLHTALPLTTVAEQVFTRQCS